MSAEQWVQHANVLIEALPYFKPYSGRVLVVKYGGNAMGDVQATRNFASDMVLLKQIGIHPIVVHGGGPQIGKMLGDLNIESNFIGGLRVTDAKAMEIAEMVLCGPVNKSIVSAINQAGGKAIGISGKDADLMVVEKINSTIWDKQTHIQKVLDLGFVGHPKTVNAGVLDMLVKGNTIPVIAPVATGEDGNTYNVNADSFAGAIATATHAKRLLLLTDVAGVLDADKKVISHLNVGRAKRLLKDGIAVGGMIPKISTCIESIEAGLEGAVMVDGRVPHSVLLEILTERGMGTLVTGM